MLSSQRNSFFYFVFEEYGNGNWPQRHERHKIQPHASVFLCLCGQAKKEAA